MTETGLVAARAEPDAAGFLLSCPRSSTAATKIDRAIAASAAALAFFAETKAFSAASAGAYAMEDAASRLARVAARSPAAVHAFAEPPCKYASSSNGPAKFINIIIIIFVTSLLCPNGAHWQALRRRSGGLRGQRQLPQPRARAPAAQRQLLCLARALQRQPSLLVRRHYFYPSVFQLGLNSGAAAASRRH